MRLYLSHALCGPRKRSVHLVRPAGRSIFSLPRLNVTRVLTGMPQNCDHASICLSQLAKPHTGRLLHFWVCLLLLLLSIHPATQAGNGRTFHTGEPLIFPRFPFSYTFFSV